MEPNGILLLNKQPGMTSQSAVHRVQRLLGASRAGHCGTLDPDATGVLPVLLGTASKAAEYLVEHDKRYDAIFLPGVETDTEDISGHVLRRFEGPLPDLTQIREASEAFVGNITQTPPMYSALKVGGVKLVDLARQGKTIAREPRQITVFSLKVRGEDDGIHLAVHCSRGTYIRTLCADLGKALGCGGCMQALVRTSVGEFFLKDAHTLDEIEAMPPETRPSLLISAEQALTAFSPVKIQPFFANLIRNGCAVEVRKLGIGNPPSGTMLRLYENESFFGVGRIDTQEETTVLRRVKAL